MSAETTKQYNEILDLINREKSKGENTSVKSDKKVDSSSSDKKEVKDKTQEIIKSVEKQNKKKENKGTGFDVKKFENLMKTKLIDEHKRIQSYERPYINVSEITSCLRKAYYYRKKYSIDLKKNYNFPYLYLINRVGKSVHSAIQELYDFSEVEKTVFSEEYNIKGRVDAIRENYLYEFKTIDPGKIKNLDANYNQGLIYSYILNKEYDYTINTITLVYVERNLKKIAVYDYLVDNDKAEKLLNNSLKLRDALKSSKVPDPLMADSEQCTFCAYKNYCKKDSSDLIKPFEEEKETTDESENVEVVNYNEKESEPKEKVDNEEHNIKRKAKFLLGG